MGTLFHPLESTSPGCCLGHQGLLSIIKMSSEEEQGPTASEEKQRPTALEEEIFGGTSSSSEDEEVIGSSDEGRRRAKGKKSAKSRSRPKGETISERVLEARRDFDEALERIKPRGGRRKAGQFDSTDPVVSTYCNDVLFVGFG